VVDQAKATFEKKLTFNNGSGSRRADHRERSTLARADLRGLTLEEIFDGSLTPAAIGPRTTDATDFLDGHGALTNGATHDVAAHTLAQTDDHRRGLRFRSKRRPKGDRVGT
jgi:hypothetical protein